VQKQKEEIELKMKMKEEEMKKRNFVKVGKAVMARQFRPMPKREEKKQVQRSQMDLDFIRYGIP